MRPFDVVVGDAGIVFPNSFDGDISFPVVEHCGASRIVGEEKEDHNTPY